MRALAVLMAFIAMSQGQVATHPATKAYRDLEFGATFRYPVDWQADIPGRGISLYPFDKNDTSHAAEPDRAAFHHPFSTPDLSGFADFQYVEFAAPDAASCRARAMVPGGADDIADKVTIAGVEFDHIRRSDGASGAIQADDAYSAFRAGKCFVFDAGLYTQRVDDDANRKLASATWSRMEAELKSIVDSIQLGWPVGFPQYPAAPDTDPSITHDAFVMVPTRLVVHRTATRLGIGEDATAMQKVSVAVGKSMSVGLRTELRVWSVGSVRPKEANVGIGLSGLVESPGPVFAQGGSGESFLNTSHGGIPRAGTKYEIEETVAVFQTAVPPQHMWMPDGKTYKVLWQGVIRRTSP